MKQEDLSQHRSEIAQRAAKGGEIESASSEGFLATRVGGVFGEVMVTRTDGTTNMASTASPILA